MIKIEDLLPHFNENIKIEHFKDEICNSLRKYNEEIEKLKEEMKKLSQNSDQLKNELKMTKNKFLIIDTQQKCEHCAKHLFNDTFYIFPCNHGFHKVSVDNDHRIASWPNCARYLSTAASSHKSKTTT